MNTAPQFTGRPLSANEMTLEQFRFNMVEQSLRPSGVLNDRVVETFHTLERDLFVAPEYKNLAYSDMTLPIVVKDQKTTETMLSPILEAHIAEKLQLKPSDSVLEIGTGSGFQAAVLSRLADHVTSVEINSAIAAQAKANLAQAGINNVKIEIGDGHAGWGNAEYDAIAVTGAVKSIPDSLKYQLAEGGRMLIIVGEPQLMTLYRITRKSPAQFDVESFFETDIPFLKGESISHFKF